MSLLRGRFSTDLDQLMRRFSSSLAEDLVMAAEDIEGSAAHAEMLAAVGILSDDEASSIRTALAEIMNDLENGRWTLPEDAEDIHMAVEARLTEKLGDTGRKLHTARSRNDQVATTVRLWLKRSLIDLDRALRDLISVLLERATTDGQTLLPGFTHLQRGQPILLGHHLLAHSWALNRDRERVRDLLIRVDRCPLGACALAGTSHPIDRELTASLLGFAGVVENAMDAVASRDHLVEAVSACSIIMVTLSRIAEELVMWSSTEFGLVSISERYTTGSSIMPQKRNPDGAELVRGKAGRVFADLLSLLTMLKGLPMAYNRDLQEDKRALIDALGETISSLDVMTAMWRTLEIDNQRFESELVGDISLATDLADFLVTTGLPFREAHEVVAAAVRACEERGGDLRLLLDDETRRAVHPDLPADLGDWLDPRSSVERRRSRGGTAWPEVQRQIAMLRETLESSDTGG